MCAYIFIYYIEVWKYSVTLGNTGELRIESIGGWKIFFFRSCKQLSYPCQLSSYGPGSVEQGSDVSGCTLYLLLWTPSFHDYKSKLPEIQRATCVKVCICVRTCISDETKGIRACATSSTSMRRDTTRCWWFFARLPTRSPLGRSARMSSLIKSVRTHVQNKREFEEYE